jgi:hypothetical protein
MQHLIEDFIEMNINGLVLELCEKYYDKDVLMLNNGVVFAESMRESYNKQKHFVQSVSKFDVKLLSCDIKDNTVELTFSYKMTSNDSSTNEWVGKHIQTWKNGTIIREEYLSIESEHQKP